MIVITGASGQLGRLAIKSLLTKLPASQIVAAVRSPERVSDLAALGVQVRHADYSNTASLATAFQNAEKLLLISSSEVGRRGAQHRNAINAAKQAGVSLLAYTSLLRADTSPLLLAGEHGETEAYLRQSAIPFVLLRNGWYTENYLASIPPALQHGAYIGSAGEGRIASAARADYAEAAAVVLTAPGQAGRIYELAGDDAYTLAEFSAELSRQSGKQIPYANLSETEFKKALIGAGLPEQLAGMLADSDAGASKGALFDDTQQLSKLIGRATTPLSSLIQAALK
jgi:NAD(P)H dehydrogenase (quinone)